MNAAITVWRWLLSEEEEQTDIWNFLFVLKSSQICLIYQLTIARKAIERGSSAAAFVSTHSQKYQDSLTLTLLICLPMVSKALNNWLWDIVCSGVPHNWILYWKYRGRMLEEYWKETCTLWYIFFEMELLCRLILIPIVTSDDCSTLIIWLM